MKTAGMNEKIAMDATDLTQLSSREQLSALMDGALPADETRFLLRRLQHDASLAECWERWRLSAEVMRGLAPAQRLPVDFASRVAASLRGDALDASSTTDAAVARKTAVRSPAWLRWGGGAAMAASLAVVAFMTQPSVLESPRNLPDNTIIADAAPLVADDAVALAKGPAPKTPAPQAPAQDPAGAGFESQTAALASAVAIMARPARNARRAAQTGAVQSRTMQSPAMLPAANDAHPAVLSMAAAANDIPPLLPQAGIITRPWPRSVLPQYATAGLSVGFGDGGRNRAPYNPFPIDNGIGNLPSELIEHANGQAERPPASDRSGDGLDGAANSEPTPQS